MLKTPIYNDTGWENLDGIKLRGRVKNGIATIVFEGYEFSGTPGSDTLVFTLPQRYWPNSVVYFNFISNNIKPAAYNCRIQTTGGIRAFAIDMPDSVIGCVTYPVK